VGGVDGNRAQEAQVLVVEGTPHAVGQINELAAKVFVTRGGRMGSGLGLLLEGLWGFYCGAQLAPRGIEIAWLADNQYNDFACVEATAPWTPETLEGELLRIEAKSMNVGADESKGHFDERVQSIGENDLLLVLLWRWAELGSGRFCPVVTDYFVGNARRVAELRDALHIERGGWFVKDGECPDHPGEACPHIGEPINASGVRERRTGPETCRGTGASYAANFGGLVRMLKCAGASARQRLREIRRDDEVAHQFISFIHRNLASEEVNAFVTSEWRQIYSDLTGRSADGMGGEEIRDELAKIPGYQDSLRLIS